MRPLAAWLLAWLVWSAMIALGTVAFVLALVAAPAVLLAARMLARRGRAPAEDEASGAVYEGEFRVLDESRVEPPRVEHS